MISGGRSAGGEKLKIKSANFLGIYVLLCLGGIRLLGPAPAGLSGKANAPDVATVETPRR
jgi:hypothetical protein